jgi:hypothetical protein
MADTDSTIVDTHSKETGKVSAIASETLSTIVWNRCPPSIGIGVRNPSEYALPRSWALKRARIGLFQLLGQQFQSGQARGPFAFARSCLLDPKRIHGWDGCCSDRRNHGREERTDRERVCSHGQCKRVPGRDAVELS